MVNAVASLGGPQYSKFSPQDYPLGVFQRAISENKNIRVALKGAGEVWLWPGSGVYRTQIDTSQFWQAKAGQTETKLISDEPRALDNSPLRPVSELLWHAAFHASQGRLIEGCEKFDVVKFSRWPNLTRLPTTANTARICALLVAHPTTLTLVRAQLKIEVGELCQTYSAAFAAGITDVLKHRTSEPAVATVANGPSEPDPSRLKTGLGILGLLRAKLSGI